MVKSYGQIIADYERADCNTRLQMFIQCPQLRSNFTLIDQETTLAAAANRPRKVRRRLGRLLGLLQLS